MKKSEKLKREAEQEENDLKALGLHTKVLREERVENFEENWLPKLRETHICEEAKNGSYTIYSTRFGIMNYYPKANRLLFRRTQKWAKPALEFIAQNLIGNEKNGYRQSPVGENDK